jgi:hypothetical protein
MKSFQLLIFWFKGSTHVPWKAHIDLHIEQAIEKSVVYVANIANRDFDIKTLHRFWFPQCNPVRYTDESYSRDGRVPMGVAVRKVP